MRLGGDAGWGAGWRVRAGRPGLRARASGPARVALLPAAGSRPSSSSARECLRVSRFGPRAGWAAGGGAAGARGLGASGPARVALLPAAGCRPSSSSTCECLRVVRFGQYAGWAAGDGAAGSGRPGMPAWPCFLLHCLVLAPAVPVSVSLLCVTASMLVGVACGLAARPGLGASGQARVALLPAALARPTGISSSARVCGVFVPCVD